MKKLVPLALAAALGSAASAQLVVAFDDTVTGVTTAWEVRVIDGSNVATPLFSNVDVWGIAADDINRKLYIASGSELFEWSYGGGTPTKVANFTFNNTTQAIVGLAFNAGKLYAVKNTANEAFYEVNTTTGVMTILGDYTDGDYDLGGFEFDEIGRAFATNDDTSPHGSGLFMFDVATGIGQKIAAYPTGETDIDGLAVGLGIAYLIEDEPGMTIHRYDLITNQYLSPIQSPMPTAEVFSAGAWAPGLVPEPATMTALALGALALLRKRSKK